MMEYDLNELSRQALSLVEQVSTNFKSVLEQWNLLQQDLQRASSQPSIPPDCVLVQKDHMAKLTREVKKLKGNLQQVVTPSHVALYSNLNTAVQEAAQAKAEGQKISAEVNHWKSRCDTVITQCESEKQEKLELQCELRELTDQMSQQSDYCASMGAACCTLLWRVSRCEDSIQSILVGSKVEEFLNLTSSTLHSYSATYQQDPPKEESEETQFVLALAGIITNIAASAYGREFLVTHSSGTAILDAFLTVLAEAPNGPAAKLKNLMLMSLYNVSINQKGLKILCSRNGIIALLVWLLKDSKEAENRLHSLRLIHSLLYDQDNFKILHEIHEAFPKELLHQLASDGNAEIRESAMELMSDLKQLSSEQ